MLYDTHIPCPTHAHRPLPGYATDGDQTCGMRLAAHLHRDATAGWEGDPDRLRAVLTVAALCGGSVHLATAGLRDSQPPVAEETVYKVFDDWRAERVEDPDDARIRDLNATTARVQPVAAARTTPAPPAVDSSRWSRRRHGGGLTGRPRKRRSGQLLVG